MGVNSLIVLPDDVRISDVAEVVGILAGLKPRWETSGDSKWVQVPGAQAKGHIDIPEMAEIRLEAKAGEKLVDGETGHFCTYHYEPDSSKEHGRLLYPRATAFWIAIGIRLAKFFGGSICYTDCGDCKPNKRFKKPRKHNNPNDGKPWRDFQEEIFNLKPVTKEELKAAKPLAAY